MDEGERIMEKLERHTKVILAIPVAVLFIALTVVIVNGFSHETPQYFGVVEATQIDVASKLPGRIESILVKEGERVTKGQILARLESKEMDAKVEQAKSAMEAARQKMIMAQRGARPEEKEAAEKLYQQAKAQYEFAEKTWKRIQRIFQDSLISTQERDQAEFHYIAAREQMEAARARYELVLQGARSEEIAAATALYHQALNAYKEACAYSKELSIVSPTDGEVYKIIVDEGEMIAAGYPVITIVKSNDVCVVIQVREDQMKHLPLGAHLKGRVRALAEEDHEFVVNYIAPMADFATWKPTHQKGDFDLKTFEIRVRPVKQVENLRPGMTVILTPQ